MRRAMTLIVALLVTASLVLHLGLPHCGGRSESTVSATGVITEKPVQPTEQIIHLSDSDRASLPDRGPRSQPGSVLSVLGHAVVAAPCTALVSSVQKQRRPSAAASPDQAGLQVYRC